MSTVTKIKRNSKNFFEKDLKNSDKELFDSISKRICKTKKSY